MQAYPVTATRFDGHGTRMVCTSAAFVACPGPAGRDDAFQPTGLPLAAVAACRIKGLGRVTPRPGFTLRGVTIRITGERQDAPPQRTRIDDAILVETGETDHRLDLLHQDLRKDGTGSHVIALAVPRIGRLERATAATD